MNVFVARQAILNEQQQTVAYEILYRSGENNAYDAIDGDTASARVLFNTFQVFSLERLTEGKPALINFSENFLTSGLISLFPSEHLVIELLETVAASEEVMERCKELKKAGYRISLDDFILKQTNQDLVPVADVIKIDWQNTPQILIEAMVRLLKNRWPHVRLVAEKVENHSDFETACAMGFHFFQGYFFCKPEMVSNQSLFPIKANLIRIMSLLAEEPIDFEELAGLISHDLSLTYHLLKLVNSAAFGRRSRIRSIRQALALLGETEIKKWMRLIVINDLMHDQPDEMIRISLIRARMAEQLGQMLGQTQQQVNNLFIGGLFSLLDVILGRPMKDALDEMFLPDAVRDCLLDKNDPLYQLLSLVIAYEQARWNEVFDLSKRVGVPPEKVSDIHLDALLWYQDLLH